MLYDQANNNLVPDKIKPIIIKFTLSPEIFLQQDYHRLVFFPIFTNDILHHVYHAYITVFLLFFVIMYIMHI